MYLTKLFINYKSISYNAANYRYTTSNVSLLVFKLRGYTKVLRPWVKDNNYQLNSKCLTLSLPISTTTYSSETHMSETHSVSFCGPSFATIHSVGCNEKN